MEIVSTHCCIYKYIYKKCKILQSTNRINIIFNINVNKILTGQLKNLKYLLNTKWPNSMWRGL